MAMHHGKNGKVKVTTDLVASVTKFSVTESLSTADSTAMGDDDETHLPGIGSWTAKVDCNYNPADTDGQVELTVGASVSVGLYTDGDATGKKYLSGTATVVGRSIEASFSDKVTMSIDLKGNGALNSATAA